VNGETLFGEKHNCANVCVQLFAVVILNCVFLDLYSFIFTVVFSEPKVNHPFGIIS
jgi:hypothetical protein